MRTLTLKNLKENLRISFKGYGHWNVVYTTPSGRIKKGVTTNSLAIDRINNTDLNDLQQGHYGYTLKQAMLGLKRICK